MKCLLVTLTIIGCALAESPYPASATKPQGALLLLPPELNQPPNKPTSSQLNEAEDLSKVSDSVMERLRQEEGSNTGSYHVYLTDGRLQKVQYTTAPVKSEQLTSKQNSGVQAYSASQRYEQYPSQQNSGVQAYSASQRYEQYPSQYKQSNQQQSGDLNPVIAQFGKLQQELQQQQIQQLQQKQQQLEQEQQRLRDQQEQLKSASYVASLQFSNVEPITSPIYSSNPAPLTRILRYAPQYY